MTHYVCPRYDYDFVIRLENFQQNNISVGLFLYNLLKPVYFFHHKHDENYTFKQDELQMC